MLAEGKVIWADEVGFYGARQMVLRPIPLAREGSRFRE